MQIKSSVTEKKIDLCDNFSDLKNDLKKATKKMKSND